MTSAAQMRARANELRDLASSLRSHAAALPDLMSRIDHARRPGLWAGSALDALNDSIQSWFDSTDDASTQLEGIAGRCDTEAERLDSNADALDRERELEREGIS